MVLLLDSNMLAFCCFGLQCRLRPKGARAFPRYGCLAARSSRSSTVFSMGFRQLNGSADECIFPQGKCFLKGQNVNLREFIRSTSHQKISQPYLTCRATTFGSLELKNLTTSQPSKGTPPAETPSGELMN